MDVNQYMEQSLELQRRTAEALEALVKAGFQQVNVAHHSCGKTVGGSQVKYPETEKKEEAKAETKQAEKKEEAKAETKQAEKKEEAKAEKKEEAKAEKKEEAKAEAKAETKKKRATADDARKALKAYAAVEGNDAAMELLTSLGAPSVSGLAESSTDEDDKLQQLIDKCAGK
ncbi:hypothetical protein DONNERLITTCHEN_00530 [Janthinobacterium phage vB_JliS-Donnerlittchen]|uniref:Uncharacterized protein n=1 Tax=Janthinobacterium phage vB_JliS-Donnerlittchen TaxID=2948610 RepID=A0A9E7SKF2_9CAUD|nr:hypothetical protein P9A49_gp54 [Janthinobacterium phage vB_JliM-Donnerlittchen]USN14454.1 hypothetical protein DONNERLITTCHEN_00530 [Janthinobacterium phage vB_JliM-Donnerlittchen]